MAMAFPLLEPRNHVDLSDFSPPIPNGGARPRAATAPHCMAAGRQTPGMGTCVQPEGLTCQADSTSSTGGRCGTPMLVNLTADNDGQSMGVPIGYEIDITLAGPPLGY